MNIVQCLSHSIEESDQLKLLTGIGHNVFSIGGYIKPDAPHDPKRPPLDVPYYPGLHAAVDALGTADNLGAAQSRLPDAILDWADTIIYHHHLEERLLPQWPRLLDWKRGSTRRRIIWRSVGQSVEYNERTMTPLRRAGLERVAYSPKEANIPGYSGHDTLIRFWKDPDEWSGWTGEQSVVINVTQHLRQRDPYTNWQFWADATRGLPAIPLGPGSEVIGGPGELSSDDMKAWLRRARCYLYTGTQPASYTLGLIEALMTGTPVVSIGPSHMTVFPYGPELFEGHELAIRSADRPEDARLMVRGFLHDEVARRVWHGLFDAAEVSAQQRARAIELFGRTTIARQWVEYLA